MSYKFVRYITKRGDVETKSPWMFEPRSIDDIHEYTKRYTLPRKRDADRRYSDNIFIAAGKELDGDPAYDSNDPRTIHMRMYGGHPSCSWDHAHYSMFLCEQMLNGRANAFEVNTHMVLKMLESRERFFNDGVRGFYDEEGLTCHALDDRFTRIVEEIETETLVFPSMKKPSIDEVKFIMWDGGKHWYAKIGKLDVVVNGEQKWNTKEEAIEAAKQYIEETW